MPQAASVSHHNGDGMATVAHMDEAEILRTCPECGMPRVVDVEGDNGRG